MLRRPYSTALVARSCTWRHRRMTVDSYQFSACFDRVSRPGSQTRKPGRQIAEFLTKAARRLPGYVAERFLLRIRLASHVVSLREALVIAYVPILQIITKAAPAPKADSTQSKGTPQLASSKSVAQPGDRSSTPAAQAEHGLVLSSARLERLRPDDPGRPSPACIPARFGRIVAPWPVRQRGEVCALIGGRSPL